jgi:DNA-binding HxlR family transcriptional regulator
VGKKTVGCPVELTLTILDGRWKAMVLRELLSGVKRFGQLRFALKDISHRTLTQQLRQLETSGIIRRKVFRQIPPKVEYSITPLGETLKPLLAAMHAWGTVNGPLVQARRQAGSAIRATRP